MTEKQKEIYNAIETFINENGYCPSRRELGAAVGLSSPATIHAHLKKMKIKGYIDYKENQSRAIVLLGRGQE